MFGIGAVSIAAGVGSPWMLGTNGIQDHSALFARVSKVWIDDARSRWSSLENHVDARNGLALRWLRWLGFEIHDVEPHGPMGMPFHKITMEGDLLCATPRLSMVQ